MKNKKPLGYYLEDFSKNFDFDKVQKAMVSLNWCWSLGTDSRGSSIFGIPNIDTLRLFAFEYVEDAYNKECRVGSGGFMAEYLDGEMYLEFTLTEWYVYED